MGGFRVGIDIGGTFTDIVFLGADGTLHTHKVASSVDDYARAIIEGIDQVFGESGLGPADVGEIRHGTTVASNAILEHKGARTGLITTKGFRDVLAIRNLRMPRLYDIAWEKPAPLVERYLRRVVDERIDKDGHVLRALERDDAEAAVDALLAEGVEAIAVCLIHSFANPAHELLIKEVIKARAPGVTACISFEVQPEIREYERTSTTVINAYVTPIVAGYLASLRRDLAAAGITAQVLLMQSNGGLTTAAAAEKLPMNIIESGPAGGVVGAQALAGRIGEANVITLDMGGTTAKASLIEAGQVTRSAEYQVGGGILMRSRLLTGSGYLLRVPAIDLAEVGAGGGSIVRIDAGGSVQVGPESAGAVPGPVCYDQGGVEPTVTDATVILGYVNPEYLVGGALPLNAAKAASMFEQRIAAPLGLELDHAAYGAVQIVASNMMRAIRSVSIERGRDPRDYALFAFGGNGPVFAATLAEALSMRRIVVPPSPGLFSSFGLLYADVEHHYGRTLRRMVRGMDLDEVEAAWAAMEGAAREQLAAEGFTGDGASVRRAATMHYAGQTFELTVDVAPGPLGAQSVPALEEAFGAEHERTYGHRAGADEPVELVTIQVVGLGLAEASRVPDSLRLDAAEPHGAATTRRAYFGADSGWLETPVLSRADLVTPRHGPCIVEEYDATCVVPPGARAEGDAFGNIVIEVG